jgi:hypothetical protein
VNAPTVRRALALFVSSVGFGFGETPVGAPLGWEITLDSMIGAIVLIGVVWGYASRGFPWCLPLAVPP